MNLDLRGRRVTVALDPFQVRVTFDSGATLAVESPFTVTGPAGTVTIDPGDVSPAEVATLDGSAVAAASIDQGSGTAIVELDDGRRMEFRADPEFEAWNFTSTWVTVVCGPGGAVSVWDHTA